jgi:uncharacterized membrane protein YfcA
MAQELLLVFVTLVASLVGTASGFGTSTIMIPVLSLSMPLPAALLFVGVIHLCGDVWKVILFRRGLIWRLVLGFGLSGIIASYFGASFSLYAAAMPLKKALGVFLILYVVFLFVKRDWALFRGRRRGSRCLSCCLRSTKRCLCLYLGGDSFIY